MSTNPISIYLAYVPADEKLLLRLRAQLSAIERIGLVDAWHDAEVDVGSDREAAMMEALHQSPIILLLISADFFASSFAYEKEMTTALALHEAGKAQVIPVILRECTWKYTPLAKLKVLPERGIPITNPHWQNPDRAFALVVEEVMKIVTNQEETSPIVQSPVVQSPIAEPIATPSKSPVPYSFTTITLNGLDWMSEDLKQVVTEGTLIEAEDGCFYDFEAAQKGCPPGWRLPTKQEWKALDANQIAQLKLNRNGLYDRGSARDKSRKGYYWSGDRSFGGQAWCFEQRLDASWVVESRYVHWAMNCRLVRN